MERANVAQIIETDRTVADAAVSGLRDTAKWIIGGVALASGGVIAGSSLTSLGSLGLEWRLLGAFFGAGTGFLALTILLSLAIDLLAPRTYSVNTIVLWREAISTRDKKPIFQNVQRMMPIGTPPIEDIARDYLNLRTNRARLSDHDQVKLENLSNLLRIAVPGIRYEHCVMMFLRLKRSLIILTPIIA